LHRCTLYSRVCCFCGICLEQTAFHVLIQYKLSTNPAPSRVEMSRRQQGPPQMDEDTQRNWRTYQGLTPDDKNRLRDKSQKWQSLPPEQQKEMRRRMEKYRELPPQDQERYQKRYKQWQSLPPEDRDRIRDRLRHWDSLSPQEKEDVRQRFQKR
jgi:hypothetical protein